MGDVVLAVGNPFGIGQTVTQGIVSAKDRVTGNGDMDEDFIQTDAAINPGNSGGALVDVEGRLVGINTAILSRSGGNQGIGFAIPSNLCQWVMTSLVKNGHVERGFLGVTIQSLTPALAQEFKLDRITGALVADVSPRQPGRKRRAQERRRDPAVQRPAGARTPASSSSRWPKPRPARRCRCRSIRDGETKTFEVTLKQPRPTRSSPAQPDREANGRRTRTRCPAWRWRTSTANMRSQVERARERATARSSPRCAPNSPAYEAGLRAGRRDHRDQQQVGQERPGRGEADREARRQRKRWSRSGATAAAVT